MLIIFGSYGWFQNFDEKQAFKNEEIFKTFKWLQKIALLSCVILNLFIIQDPIADEHSVWYKLNSKFHNK